MSYHDILNVILFNIKKILLVTIITGIFIILLLKLVFPLTFHSSVSILPPEKNNSLGGVSSLIGAQGLSSLMDGSLGTATSQLYAEILKSRTAAEYVVKKHNLTEFYDEEKSILAVEKLSNNLRIDISKEGIISLYVDISTSFFPLFSSEVDSIKILSAKLSNSYVEALDKINREKISIKAKRAREYIEKQLVITKSNLDSVENALVKFKQENKTISLPDQLTAALDAAGQLKSEIVKTEIQLGLMQKNLTENNKTLIGMQNKLQELREQYRKMETGNQDYLLEFEEVPELGKELAELMREVRIQNEVYIMLQQQYYKEKIQENRDIPTIEVLDKAIPPLTKSAPQTLVSAALGSIFVFFLMSFLFVIREKKIVHIKNNNQRK